MTTDDPEAAPAESQEPVDWSLNYFNYFTEIEEHFRQARGTGLFLVSPLDWALIDNWRTSGVPLEAVLRGIDDAFEKWRSRKNRRRLVNSIAYCAQAVMERAQRLGQGIEKRRITDAPFEREELVRHLTSAADHLRKRSEVALVEVAAALDSLAAQPEKAMDDLESLEQRLSAMEDKVVGALRSRQTEEELFSMRQALDAELRPYRGKMSAEQLAMLERRYLDTALLDRAEVPRLSLFYIK